jgi:hypothetical protein
LIRLLKKHPYLTLPVELPQKETLSLKALSFTQNKNPISFSKKMGFYWTASGTSLSDFGFPSFMNLHSFD